MKTTKKAIIIILLMAMALMTFSPALAQDEEVSLCEGENVSGTVVEVDEEAETVTIDTGDGLCYVTIDADYDHPIVALLGEYFDEVNPEALAEALEAMDGCVLMDEESGDYSWVDCETEGAEDVTVTGENEDGTFTAENGDGEEITVVVEDEEAAGDLSEALETLAVDWELDEDGNVVDAGDDIAAYHDDGIGFGVLVKIYAIAEESQEACAAEEEEGGSEEEQVAEGEGDGEGDIPSEEEPCGVTVEELIELYEGGMSMGEMFAEFGKPSMLGVGHVRQALGGSGDGDGDGGDGDGICNARAHGGKAYANGQDPDCE